MRAGAGIVWRAALGSVAALAGLCLAWAHPLALAAATALFTAWLVVCVIRPGVWLFVLPTLLPWISFAPWTGWILFDEFDLVCLGAIGGGYLRWAADRPGASGGVALMPARWAWSAWLFGAVSAVALWRGLAGAGADLDPFQGEADPINGLRLFKPLAFVLLLWPLLQRECLASTQRALRRLGRGMLAGLAVVVAVALWERAAFPGLLEFSAPYRTTALFWEMHVGGAAIDVYLALSVPFVAWALVSAKTPQHWLVAAVLALLTAYVCLTTFSRGVYLAVVLPLLCLGIVHAAGRIGVDGARRARFAAFVLLACVAAAALFGLGFERFGIGGALVALVGVLALIVIVARRGGRWRPGAAWALGLALLFEAALVFHTGSFMSARLAASERDFGSRQAHWQHGLGLLQSPADWVWGIGLGRLPARYAGAVPQREFSGALQMVPAAPGRQAARLQGPPTQADLGGLYAMTQRLPAGPPGAYRLQLDARADAPALLQVRVCEMHLLYESRCQSSLLQLGEAAEPWQRRRVILEGPGWLAPTWLAPRPRVFALSVLSPGAAVDIAALQLFDAAGRQVLANADFAQGPARWFPVAQAYYLPWHIDNLYLELLIERGVFGLLAFLAMISAALHGLLRGPGRSQPMARFVAAALGGVLIVGLVSSVMDAPRVAFLFQWLVVVGLSLGRPAAAGAEPCGTVQPPGPRRGARFGTILRAARAPRAMASR